jgi:hypothetical protein
MDEDRNLRFCTAEEAATSDYCVCIAWTNPPVAKGNRRRICIGGCGTALQQHPSSPKGVPPICVECMTRIVMRH